MPTSPYIPAAGTTKLLGCVLWGEFSAALQAKNGGKRPFLFAFFVAPVTFVATKDIAFAAWGKFPAAKRAGFGRQWRVMKPLPAGITAKQMARVLLPKFFFAFFAKRFFGVSALFQSFPPPNRASSSKADKS
jgi:hypothetical protein